MVDDIAKEQVIAARISGVAPSMHVILSPNTDGDEATITTADIIAGRSYMHKVDAVLVPKSMLKFLEGFSNKKEKKGKNATVTEALKGGNATANATKSANRTKAADAAAAAELKANKTYLNSSSVPNDTKNAAPSSKAAKSAGTVADVAFSVMVGLPLLLASVLVL